MNAEGEAVDHPGPHEDSFGHGTAVAGIVHSLAPEARITSVKVLGAGLGGKAAVFLRGLGWAVEQRFDVINLSLGANRREWALPCYEICDEAYFRPVQAPRAAAVPAEDRAVGDGGQRP